MDLLTGLPRPTRTALADARGTMTPAEAGHLVGITEAVWIGFETDFVMPMATWALFLLATGQHPTATLDPRAHPPGVPHCSPG